MSPHLVRCVVVRDSVCPMLAAQRIYQQVLREAAREVDLECGGLKHIELAENDVTDLGAKGLCAALGFDRRLVRPS